MVYFTCTFMSWYGLFYMYILSWYGLFYMYILHYASSPFVTACTHIHTWWNGVTMGCNILIWTKRKEKKKIQGCWLYPQITHKKQYSWSCILITKDSELHEHDSNNFLPAAPGRSYLHSHQPTGNASWEACRVSGAAEAHAGRWNRNDSFPQGPRWET